MKTLEALEKSQEATSENIATLFKAADQHELLNVGTVGKYERPYFLKFPDDKAYRISVIGIEDKRYSSHQDAISIHVRLQNVKGSGIYYTIHRDGTATRHGGVHSEPPVPCNVPKMFLDYATSYVTNLTANPGPLEQTIKSLGEGKEFKRIKEETSTKTGTVLGKTDGDTKKED